MAKDGSATQPSVGKKQDPVARGIQLAAIGLGWLFMFILFAWLILSHQHAALTFHFNFFSLLSAASLISNLFAFVLITRVKERGEVVWWFSIFTLSLAAWAGAEMMLRLSGTPEAAAFWSPLTTLGAVFMPISLYMFALAYTEPKRIFSPHVFPILLAVSTFLVYLDNSTVLLTNYDPKLMIHAPWGFITATGPAFILITLWLVLLSFGAFLLLYRFRRRTIEPTLRRQTKLFMIAIIIPLVGGGLTDGVLPALHSDILPPMTVMLLTIMGLMIAYGIRRHRFFSFTPALIANQILDTMNEAVIGTTPDLHLTFANNGAEQLLGMSTKQLMNKRLFDFFNGKWSSEDVKAKLFDHLKTESVFTIDAVDLQVASGSPVTVKLSITKVAGDDQPNGYLIVLTDITTIAQTQAIIEHQVAEQTKTIRETKSKLVSSINSLEFGFMITDNQPEIIMTNEAAHKLFCGSREHDSAECTTVSMASIQEQMGATNPIQQTVQTCLTSLKPQTIKLLTFQDRSWRLFVSPVVDGQHVIGTAIILQDITEEQVLARSRDEFFSIASHELRTPLTAIRGNSSMMIDFFPEVAKNPDLAAMAHDVHDSSERLIAIVNDFLDMSRLEQHKVAYNLAAVELPALVEKAVHEVSPASQEKGVLIKLGAGLGATHKLPAVIADSQRLVQIIHNLLDNALKFTEHGDITISAAAHASTVKLSVSDTGRGIDPTMQNLLFHKFQQANASLLTRDTTRGTGLGLYISRLLAEAMGGNVTLDHSVVGKGSTFTITLPVATPEKLKKLKASLTQTDAQSGLTVTSD